MTMMLVEENGWFVLCCSWNTRCIIKQGKELVTRGGEQSNKSSFSEDSSCSVMVKNVHDSKYATLF